jgi:hypothetical protein
MPHSLTVTGVQIFRYPTSAGAVLTALGPRGGAQEWAVDFDRKGSIKSAVRLVPSYAFHADPTSIPEEIAKAARNAYAQS